MRLRKLKDYNIQTLFHEHSEGMVWEGVYPPRRMGHGPIGGNPYTGWPRKNVTTLIVNFKDIINKTESIFILLCGKFIFQQNDTMIIKFG